MPQLTQRKKVQRKSRLQSTKSLHEPDWSRVSPMMPNSSSEFDKVRTPVAKHELHSMEAGAKPIYEPHSPELAALVRRLEKANRKREAERRR
jgi:hypothetical protein